MAWSGPLSLLLCILLVSSSTLVNAQPDTLVYKFSSGDMACTNRRDGVTCTMSENYEMNSAPSSASHRNVISLFGDGNYALGFERATAETWYLAIYLYYCSNRFGDASVWRASTPDGTLVEVPFGASLVFVSSGNLVLRDPTGALRWSSNSGGLGVTELVLATRGRGSFSSPAGNMILYNSANEIVWQSLAATGPNKFRLDLSRSSDVVCKVGVDCFARLGLAVNPSQGSDVYKTVISHQANGKYALGFERRGTFFSFSIYQWNETSKGALGPSIWKASYGRSDVPVRLNNGASVTFGQNGAVELRDQSQKLVWTTGTKGRASDLEFNFDSGELYLYNREGSIVWRSGGESSWQYVTLYAKRQRMSDFTLPHFRSSYGSRTRSGA